MPKYLKKSYPYTYKEMMKDDKHEMKEFRSAAAPMMRKAAAGKRAGMAALRRLKKY